MALIQKVNRKVLLTGLAVLCSSMAGAAAPNGVETSEFSVDGYMYVDCLGATIHITGTIEERGHVFTTAAGVFHLLGNWTYHFMAEDPTGRRWVATGVSPAQENTVLGKNDVFHFVARQKYQPLTPDTPKFFWYESYKLIVNANGDIVLERYELVDGFGQCVGPKDR